MLLIRNYKLKISVWGNGSARYQLDGEATWINPKAICSIVEELDCKLIDNKFQYATLYRLSFCNKQEIYVDAEDFQDILLASDPEDPTDDYFSSKRRR